MRRAFGAVLFVLSLSAQTPTFTVTHSSPSTLDIDTRHGSGNIFEFTVSNNASSLDYITIQRSLVRSNGQPVFGVPSPEFGVSVPPGATAKMWFRWDLVGQVLPGNYTAIVPFKSELTGAMVNATIGFHVTAPELLPPVTFMMVSQQDDITYSVSNLTTGIDDIADLKPPSAGLLSFTAQPGDYAVIADAPGLTPKTAFITLKPYEATAWLANLHPVLAQADANATISRVINVPDSIWTMRASANTDLIATAPMGSNNPSAFHGIKNGQLLWTSTFPGLLQNRSGNVSQFQATDCDVAVSNDGTLVAGMDYNGKVYLLDGATGTTRWSTDRAGNRNPLYPPNSVLGDGFFTCGAVAFNQDGSALAAGGSNGSLAVFETLSGALRWTQSYSSEIRALRFTPDNTRLAVGAGDWKFRMLSATTGDLVWSAPNQFWPLFFIGRNETGTLIGSGGKDSEFQLWNANTGDLQWKKKFPGGAFVSGAAISSTLGRVYVSDWTNGVRAYDLNGQPLWMRKLANASMAVTPDGEYLFTGGISASGTRIPVLYLMDRNGTILWQTNPDTTNHCRVQAPFASDFFKSVAVARSGSGAEFTIKAVAACVGGSIFSFEIPVKVDESNKPIIGSGGIVNAASYSNKLAPSTIASVFGQKLSSAVAVTVNGYPAQIYNGGAQQINFLVPPNTAPGPATVVVETLEGLSDPYMLMIDTAAPGIFYNSANGIGAILISGTANTTDVQPAKPGDYLEIYATGLGPAATPTVRIAGINAQVLYSGQTGTPGLYQVNVQVPQSVPTGTQELTLSINGATANTVKVQISQ